MKSLSLLAFWALGIIWGSNFIYMKLASEFLTTSQIVFWRVLFGFLPVMLYAYLSRELKWRHLRHSGHFLVMALLATTVYYYGFAKGASLLYSGIAGALSGSIPLFSFILAALFLADEKPNIVKIAGVTIGFIGVIIIARPTGGGLLATNLEGVIFMIIGSLSVGASFVYARKFITPLKIPVSALTSYQLFFALLLLAAFMDTDGINDIWTDLHAAAGLVLGLGILGTGLAYIIYYFIVDKLGALTASSVTYIPPVIALLIGSILVGEPIEIVDYAATAIIFTGVFLLRLK